MFALQTMIAVLQRVSHAEVATAGQPIATIGRGLLALVGVERDDTAREAERLLERMLGYRVFPDEQGRMNLSVADIDGSLLLVPQFTLAADTQKGTRPSFSSAAMPEEGRRLFEHLVACAHASYLHVGVGAFGADMQVTLTNDGPVTFWLRVPPAAGGAR